MDSFKHVKASKYSILKVSHNHMKDLVLICLDTNLDHHVKFIVSWIVLLVPFLVQQDLKLTTYLCQFGH